MSPREELLTKAVTWFAENGVGDTSMRTLASELGTSHRMLHYHFGSREGLLSAVVETVERGERDMLSTLFSTYDDPYVAGAAYWAHVADAAQTFAPLYFELAGQAMQGKAHAAALRDWLANGWTEALTEGFASTTLAAERATEVARLSLATARGLLFELALTGDRAAADAAMVDFIDLLRDTPSSH